MMTVAYNACKIIYICSRICTCQLQTVSIYTDFRSSYWRYLVVLPVLCLCRIDFRSWSPSPLRLLCGLRSRWFILLSSGLLWCDRIYSRKQLTVLLWSIFAIRSISGLKALKNGSEIIWIQSSDKPCVFIFDLFLKIDFLLNSISIGPP